MSRLILFDIDGTLTDTGGHIESFQHALKNVYRKDTPDLMGYSGMSDIAIAESVLKQEGLSEKEIEVHLSSFIVEMGRHYDGWVKENPVGAFKGIPGILGELKARGFVLGLVTGNVESIAWAKLGKAGIAGYFSFGGFGSDHKERAEIVRRAIERARNAGFSGRRVFVVGDTPRDIEAGLAANAVTIGVASGDYSDDELRKAGAHHVMESLAETERFLEIVG